MTATETDLDEAARRKPDFRAGPAVRLCGGRDWTLPRVTYVGWHYAEGPDGRAAMEPTCEVRGAEGDWIAYSKLVAGFAGAVTAHAAALALYELAAYLLGRNYDLADRDLARLLRLVPPGLPGHAENRAMWTRLSDLAVGSDPDAPATAGGAPAAAAPTA
jgi:hypothetical protein